MDGTTSTLTPSACLRPDEISRRAILVHKESSADEAEIRDGAAPLGSAVTEAANRAEVTALLIRCGYRVYRSEADIDGEDLVVRTPSGELRLVQLKGRPTVEWKRYGGRGLWMLFPSGPWRPDAARAWFLVPHDPFFAWVKARHGHTPKWAEQWSYPTTGKDLAVYLAEWAVKPSASAIEGWSEVLADE